MRVGIVLGDFPRDSKCNGIWCNVSLELLKIKKTKLEVKIHLLFIILNYKGKLKGWFIEAQNIFLNLLMGSKITWVLRKSAHTMLVFRRLHASASDEPGTAGGPIRMSRRHCSGWPSARTPHRFHSTGAPRSDCRGVWSGEGPPTPAPGWGSPLCRGGQSSHICHRRGEVSSWTVSPGRH